MGISQGTLLTDSRGDVEGSDRPCLAKVTRHVRRGKDTRSLTINETQLPDDDGSCLRLSEERPAIGSCRVGVNGRARVALAAPAATEPSRGTYSCNGEVLISKIKARRSGMSVEASQAV